MKTCQLACLRLLFAGDVSARCCSTCCYKPPMKEERACCEPGSLEASYVTLAGITQPCTADVGVTSYSWRTVCPPPTLRRRHAILKVRKIKVLKSKGRHCKVQTRAQ